MRLILQEKFLALEDKNEHRDFKRIADSTQVSSFYNQCCTNLLSAIEWNKLTVFYPISKITFCDKYGFNINRAAIKGDIIKIEYQPTSDFDNILNLKVDSLNHTKEHDEELYELDLKVELQPDLGRFYNFLNNKPSCKIKARRIINTISIEAKINVSDYPNPFMEADIKMVSQFPWDRLIKNTLSKL